MAKRKQSRGQPPERVMEKVYWSFVGEPYQNPAQFHDEVRQYQIDITREDTWHPEVVTLPYPRIDICYMYWQDDDQLDGFLELAADDGKAFTAGELLFKIHNAVVGPLREDNHHFFEGLVLHSEVKAGETPCYVLSLGS